MNPRMLLIPLLLLAAVALAGCGSKSTGPAYGGGPGGTPTGPTISFSFPATGVSHTFTFAAGDTGSWGYHCIAHQSMGMVGTVIVNASGSDSALVVVGVPDRQFSPTSVTVKPGGYVRWVNQSALTNHTVTRP